MDRTTRPYRFSLALIAILLMFPAAAAFGEIFACAGDSIRVFADDAGLGSTPIRTIAGPTSGVAQCYGIALDNLHNELWVTSQTTVRVFDARANGDIAPLRTITGFGIATGVAVDVEADEVFVGTGSALIAVYPRTATGSPAPLRTLHGDGAVVGLFVDRVNDKLYVESYAGDDTIGNVVVFKRQADGEWAYFGVLGSFPAPFGLVVDAHGKEVFVATGPGYGTVEVYDLKGHALRTIGGSSSLLTRSAGLSLLQNGTLLTGNQYESATTPDAIFGYMRMQNGDVAPTVQINLATPPAHALWGIASTHAFECGEGNTTSYCLFRSSFE